MKNMTCVKGGYWLGILWAGIRKATKRRLPDQALSHKLRTPFATARDVNAFVTDTML
jgi:hypothetical protein